MNWLYPIHRMIEAPYLALIPSAIFVLGYAAQRLVVPPSRHRVEGWIMLGVAALWAAYGAYEYAVTLWRRAAEPIGAEIRIDLLLIVPVLYLATLVGLGAWLNLVRVAVLRRPHTS